MRLRHLFSKPKAAELNDELKFHFESLVQENPSKRQSFGGPTEQRRVVRLNSRSLAPQSKRSQCQADSRRSEG